MWGELARDFADSLVLPLNVVTYAKQIESYVSELEKGYGQLMLDNGVSLGMATLTLT